MSTSSENAPHKTIIGAWSAPTPPGGQVSTPFVLGRAEHDHPRQLHHRHRPPPRLRTSRRCMASDGRTPQPLEPLSRTTPTDMAAGFMHAPGPLVYPKMPNEPPRVAPSSSPTTLARPLQWPNVCEIWHTTATRDQRLPTGSTVSRISRHPTFGGAQSPTVGGCRTRHSVTESADRCGGSQVVLVVRPSPFPWLLAALFLEA